jgi:hypothetical protein
VQYPEVVAHHDKMAENPKINEYLLQGERKDEFMPDAPRKSDWPQRSWSSEA